MPPRTNDFQALVFFLRQELGGDAATYTESALVKDPDGGEREIDILIEGEVAGTPIKVAIECNGEARKRSVGWVEQMAGKYRDLKIDKVVLVAKAGFTSQAEKKADRLGFETLTYQEAEAEEAGPRVLFGPSLALIEARTQIDAVHVQVSPPSGEAKVIRAEPGHLLFFGDGEEASSFLDFITQLRRTPGFLRGLFQAPPPSPDERIAIEWPAPRVKRHSNGVEEPLALRWEETEDLHEVGHVRVILRARITRAPVALRGGRIGSQGFRWGNATVGDGRALLVIPDGQSVAWVRSDAGDMRLATDDGADQYSEAGGVDADIDGHPG